MNDEIAAYNSSLSEDDGDICRRCTVHIVKEIKVKDLIRWLKKSRDIQWDDKDIVKRKGVLQRLK